ncbi:unnamed protein product [Sympodiomycopsis kandeliae]
MSSQPLLRVITHPHKHVLDRASSYLATIDQWSAKRGLSDVVREKTGGGGGKLAVVAALAAQSLGSSYKAHSEIHYQKQSGLSPNAFKLAMTFLSHALAATSEMEPRTPSKRQRIARNLDDDGILTSSPSSSSKTTTPGSGSGMSLKERAMAVQNGSAFGINNPSTPRRRPQGSSTPTKNLLTPSRSSLRTPSSSSSNSRDGQDDGGSPRSVRFSDHEDDTAVTPKSRMSRSNSATTAYEHPYTPSKRSRLGPGDTPSHKRSRRGDADEQESDSLAVGPLLTPRQSARQSKRAAEQIGFALFPLDDVYLAKMGITHSSDDQIDVHKWLNRWGSWLDEH